MKLKTIGSIGVDSGQVFITDPATSSIPNKETDNGILIGKRKLLG